MGIPREELREAAIRLLEMFRSVLLSTRTEGGRQVLRNLLGLLGCTTISQLCGFGIILLTARHLGPEQLGIFLFALTVQNYLLQLGGVGAGPALIRETGAEPQRTDEFVASYLILVGSATALVTSCAFLGLAVASPAVEERTLWVWILLGNLAASLNLLPLFDAQHRQARAALVAALVDVLTLAGFLTAALTDRLGLVLAGQLMAFKWGAIALTQGCLYALTVRPVRWTASARTVRQFLTSGLSVLIAFLLLLAPLNGGVLLVRLLRTEEETALLGLATQMATVHLLFCLQVARIVQPHIAGPHGLQGWFIRRMALAYGGIALGLTAGAALVGSGIIVWFLPRYLDALPPLFLLLTGSLVLAAGYIASLYLHRHRRERTLLICYLAGGGVFLGLAVWLIGAWGPIGAGVALVASAAVSAGLMTGSLRASAGRDRSSGNSENTTAATS